jgi:hypothetical protein
VVLGAPFIGMEDGRGEGAVRGTDGGGGAPLKVHLGPRVGFGGLMINN